ncbi:MAG: M48 family metallopeptidase [Nitrospirota bacterium]
MLILLAGYLFVQGIEYWLKFINLSHMKKYGKTVPRGFEGYIDEELLKKTHSYTLEHSSLSFMESIFSNVVLLVFLFGGLLDVYNSWIASLDMPFFVQGAIFFLLLSYASTVVSIPFSLYSTFKIENKYGFNTMTVKLWITDLMKSILISTVLTGLLLVVGLWIIQASPDYWWLFVWGFFFIFSIFIMYISPYVIEPLFNKFTPLEGDELEDRIRDMMKKAGIKVSRIFKIDASKRSHHTNAYFTGIGKVKRIVLYDTLIKKMELDEILAVLAHEVGHWKKKHVLKRIILFEMMSLTGAYAAFETLKTDFFINIFGISEATIFAKLVILGFIFSIVSFPFTPFFSYLSRRHENEADRFAVGLTADPESLATSLIKLSKDNLSNLHPHPFYAKFYYSHPPVVERIKSIRGDI